jgi:hypothetical protein
VRDQSYEDGAAPYRARHVRIASRTRSGVQSGAIAPGWQRAGQVLAVEAPAPGVGWP